MGINKRIKRVQLTRKYDLVLFLVFSWITMWRQLDHLLIKFYGLLVVSFLRLQISQIHKDIRKDKSFSNYLLGLEKMLFSLFSVSSLETKRAITIVIEANIQFLILGHELLKLFIGEGLAMVSEKVFEESMAFLCFFVFGRFLLSGRLLLGDWLFRFHESLAKKIINLSA